MPGLARIDDLTLLAAFQAIDRGPNQPLSLLATTMTDAVITINHPRPRTWHARAHRRLQIDRAVRLLDVKMVLAVAPPPIHPSSTLSTPRSWPRWASCAGERHDRAGQRTGWLVVL